MVKKKKEVAKTGIGGLFKAIIATMGRSFRLEKSFFIAVVLDFLFYAIFIGVVYLFFTKILMPNLEILGNANIILEAMQSDPSRVEPSQVQNLKDAVWNLQFFLWTSICVLLASFFVLKGFVWALVSERKRIWRYLLYFTIANLLLAASYIIVGGLLFFIIRIDLVLWLIPFLIIHYFYVSSAVNSLDARFNLIIILRRIKNASVRIYKELLAANMVVLVFLFIFLGAFLLFFIVIDLFPLVLRRIIGIGFILFFVVYTTWAKRFIYLNAKKTEARFDDG